MFTQTYQQIGYANIMAILNHNCIEEKDKHEAVKAMGLAACQARCLNCGYCAHHAGK